MVVKKKEKGDLSSVNGGGIQRRSIISTDHWAFLEEMEAPMWVDLALEAQSMDQDIDDSWFRISHPIHQMSSRHLKSSFPFCVQDKPSSPKLLCHSPKLPDSVSRSRGKDYSSKKWAGNEHVVSVDKQHPIRKLGGKSLGMVMGQKVTSCSSASTVTTNSSLAKLRSRFVDPKCNSNLNSSFATSSSRSVISRNASRKPKLSFGGPRNTSNAKSTTTEVSCSISITTSTLNPRRSSITRASVKGEMEDEKILKSRKSSSSKSSVGSSLSLGFKLESINFTAMPKEERSTESKIAKSAVSFSKKTESRIPDKNSNSKCQSKAANVKSIHQESKSKVVGSTAPRRPLRSLNEARPVKNRIVTRARQNVGAGKINLGALSNKENTVGRVIQNPRALKCSTTTTSGNGLSNPKGKLNGGNQERNITNLIPRTYFR